MKKFTFVGVMLFVLMLIAGILLAGCDSAAQDDTGEVNEIKVGILLPFTGSVAIIGDHNWKGHELAAKEINEAGGIKSLNGAKIKLVKADTTSDPKVGMTEVERLITEEKVVCVMGAYQSAVTYPTTTIAEKYQIPYIVPVAVKDDITDQGFQYTFRLAAKASWWARDQLKFLEFLEEESGIKVETLAFVYENTDWGQSTKEGLEYWMKELGLTEKYKVVLDEPYPAEAPDVTPVILKLKEVNPDVVLMVSYTGDAIKLSNAMAEMKFRPMAIIGNGAGHADPVFIESCGENAEYALTISEFANDSDNPEVVRVLKAFEESYGYPIPEPSVNGYACTYILADALERCGSTDPEKIRDALAETNISSGPATIVPFDLIEFGPDGQSIHSALIGMQVQNGKFNTVWPKAVAPAGNKPIFPMP